MCPSLTGLLSLQAEATSTRNVRLNTKSTRSSALDRGLATLAMILGRRTCSVGHLLASGISVHPEHATFRLTAALQISLISIRTQAAISVTGRAPHVLRGVRMCKMHFSVPNRLLTSRLHRRKGSTATF